MRYRGRIAAALGAVVAALLAGPGTSPAAPGTSFEVDHRRLVSRADLRLDRTLDISDHGLPIGNGRMGSLVWTSPCALKFQINRVDVHANGCETESFNRRDHDYSCACGLLDIELVDFGADVFPREGTRQHLAVFDGLATITGPGVSTAATAWQDGDVFAVRIEDHRDAPGTIRARLQALRPRVVHTLDHTAESDLLIRDGRVALRQTFREGDFFCSSAVVVAVTGRRSQPRLADASGGRVSLPAAPAAPGLGQPTETQIELLAEPGRGELVVWIASAASRDPEEDVVATAARQLDAAVRRGWDGVRTDNAARWEAFWSRSFVHLTSADGVADEIERHRTYFLYLMACCSRGACPPKSGGLVFGTHGDRRSWGAQHWWTNTSIYYRPLLAAGHADLTDPLFRMYLEAAPTLERAARQYWGASGLFVPETMWFDGVRKLPDDIAAEMPDLALLEKPWDQRSPRFDRYAAAQHPHCPAWNWMAAGQTWEDGRWTIPTKGAPPFGHVTHLLSPNAELAHLAWKRFEYTGDVAWLQAAAYPLLRGAAEFYRTFPGLTRDAGGVCHIGPVNHGEGLWGARDTFEVIGMIRALVPTAIRAAEMLDVDADLRAGWRDLLDHIATIPTSDEGHAVLRDGYDGPPVWVSGRPPVVRGTIKAGLPGLAGRVWEVDTFNVETRFAAPAVWKLALDSYRYSLPAGIGPDAPVHELSQVPVVAAKLGLADDFRNAVANILKSADAEHDFCQYEQTWRTGVLANRMTLREGVNAIGAQRLGTVTSAVQEALCQSDPPVPAGAPVLTFFPAWPADWNAQFCLAARGQFVVGGSWRDGRAEFVEILSQAGRACRVRNPWPAGTAVMVHRNGAPWRRVSGDLLTFDTEAGGRYLLLPEGESPESVRRAVPADS